MNVPLVALPTTNVDNIGDDVPINVHIGRHGCVWCQQASHKVTTGNLDVGRTFTKVPQNVVRVSVTFPWVDGVILLVIVVQLDLSAN